MVTKPNKHICEVCGKEVQSQGLAMHNKSKFHLDALAKQTAKEEPQERQEVQQTKPVPTITSKPEIKQEVRQTKSETVQTTKPQQQQQEITQDAGYNGLKWD